MKVYTYSEARQKFSMVFDIARFEDVIIKRRGKFFIIKQKKYAFLCTFFGKLIALKMT